MSNVDHEVFKWMKKYAIPGAAAAVFKGECNPSSAYVGAG
jgi:hypothetical protein